MSDNLLVLRSIGDSTLPPLVLVHGWGHSAEVWQPLVEQLEGHFYLHLLSLPGYSACDEKVTEFSADQLWQLENLLNSFEQLPIGPARWCGWSLGGMLAALYAARCPDRVEALVTIASNAVFSQRNDWVNAMPTADFESFNESLLSNPKVTLTRFLALISQGSETARTDLRFLKGCISVASPATLQASLKMLNVLDSREALKSLSVPQLHIFGEQDALVPVAVGEDIAQLNPVGEVKVVANAGHAPLLSHPQKVAELLIGSLKP